MKENSTGQKVIETKQTLTKWSINFEISGCVWWKKAFNDFLLLNFKFFQPAQLVQLVMVLLLVPVMQIFKWILLAQLVKVSLKESFSNNNTQLIIAVVKEEEK